MGNNLDYATVAFSVELVDCHKYQSFHRHIALQEQINSSNAELNPICYLLVLLGVHSFLHVSRIRVKSLTLRLLISYIYIYIYMEHLFLMFLDHTTTHYSR